MRARLLAITLIAALLGCAPAALADRGDVLVRFRAAATSDDRGDARRAAKVRRRQGLPVPGLELASPEPGVTAAQAAARLEREPGVLYAEPDAPRHAFATFPDDELFGYEWGLHNVGQPVGGVAGAEDADVDAPEAWDLTTGAPGVVVAVLDTGVDVAHPDLAPNVWVNAGEVAGNGEDDDGNGFVDDVRGWDFVERDGTPQDEDGHGTHVAGTAGARGGDGAGVAGGAWRATLLPLRILGPDGSGAVSDAIRAYAYATQAGARVVNLSLGGPAGSRAERDAIAARPGVLFVAAAGNDGANNDAAGAFPCNYDVANVVCVAASDQSDALAEFSNYGAKTVDLAAPGVSIASTYPDGRWALMDGTSMATPLVSGVAALLAARDPAATTAELRAALLQGVDRKLSLAAQTATGGRLNALGALRALDGEEPPPEPEPREEEPPPPSPAPSPEPSPAPEPAPEPQPAPEPPPSGPAPAPAGEPAPAPLAPPDVSAPFATFTVAPARGLRTLVRRRGARLALRCNEPCSLRIELRRGPRVLARASRTIPASGQVAVRLRIGGRELARLRAVRAVRLTLRVRAADPAGNVRVVTRRLTFRRR